jgi:predicted dehydrogenase
VTRSAERRQQLAGDYPQVLAFDTLEQLVAAGVDAVVVSTPLDGRPAIVMQAIELGVAVVSDKPFALDAAQAEAMVLAAERRNVPLSVYQNRRWDSDFLTVRKLLASGALGQVIRFESSVERYSPTSVGKGSGGGFLRDLGSHLVDQALQLFGPVTRVYAELDYRQPGQAFDNGFFMSLTHVGGVISHLSGNCVQNAPRPRFRVSGSEGCYTVEGLDGQEAQALAGLSPATEGERWGAEEHRRWGWFEHGAERERVASERGCWLEFYQRLQAALQGDGALPVAARDALATTRILDAARQSAEQGEVVCLSAPVGHGTKNE